MKVKTLRKVQKFLLEEPRRFEMSRWISRADENKKVLEPPPCGTACCIGGAALIVERDMNPKNAYNKISLTYIEFEEQATRALGLTECQAERLFYSSNWPRRFRTAYDFAKTPIGRVKAGVARIEHFIKTKGAK